MNEADPGTIARRLLLAADRASLATVLARDVGPGFPYASLVQLATDADGQPLMLLSDLADHTKNLKADPRASLLVDGTGGYEEPLTGPRVTLVGRLEQVEAGPRYLARHPSAAMYAGFKDFHFYRLVVTAGHLVAGFGRIHWIGPELIRPMPPALAGSEAGILEHMNQDHADACALIATGGRGGGEGWSMVGIDAEGADFRRGGQIVRVDFPAPIAGPGDARKVLVQLTQQARAAAGG